MLSLLEGREMKGDEIFPIIVVIGLVVSITATYCLTKNKHAEQVGDGETNAFLK